MRIGVAQIDTKAGDLAGTTQRMALQCQAASARGVDLLVFPVAALCGPAPVGYGAQTAFLADVDQALKELAAGATCDCLVPVVLEWGDYPLIEAMLVRDGRVTALRLGALAMSQSQRDADAYDRLDEPVVMEVGQSRVGLAFSYDDLEAFGDYDADVDVVVFLSAYGYAVDDPSSALGAALGENRFATDATELGAWVVGVGSLGGYGAQVFSGSSFALAPDGSPVAIAPAFEEDLLVADVGKGAGDGAASLQGELYDDRYHLWQALVLGIRDFVQKLGLADVALSIDGSLSSMLLAVLATDALGPLHVHALLCPPAGHPRMGSLSSLVRSLRVHVHALGEVPEGVDARDYAALRLGAVAREVGALALSSADKTALALECGFGELRCGDLAPLGDVYRVDVLDVARLRNTVSPVLPPLDVVALDVPDVGQGASRFDYESMLERIDAVLASHVEGEWGLSEIVASLGNADIARGVLGRLYDRAAVREAAPLCLTLTTKTLLEARLPLGFAWSDHVREHVAQPAERPAAAKPQQHERPHGEPQARRVLQDLELSDELLESDEIREALGLLRDLSGSANIDWRNPFSEN